MSAIGAIAVLCLPKYLAVDTGAVLSGHRPGAPGPAAAHHLPLPQRLGPRPRSQHDPARRVMPMGRLPRPGAGPADPPARRRQHPPLVGGVASQTVSLCWRQTEPRHLHQPRWREPEPRHRDRLPLAGGMTAGCVRGRSGYPRQLRQVVEVAVTSKQGQVMLDRKGGDPRIVYRNR